MNLKTLLLENGITTEPGQFRRDVEDRFKEAHANDNVTVDDLILDWKANREFCRYFRYRYGITDQTVDKVIGRVLLNLRKRKHLSLKSRKKPKADETPTLWDLPHSLDDKESL